jgi:hypothetical protein
MKKRKKERKKKKMYDSSSLKLGNAKYTYLLCGSTRDGAFTIAAHHHPSFASLIHAFIYSWNKSHSTSSSELFLRISLVIQDSSWLFLQLEPGWSTFIF